MDVSSTACAGALNCYCAAVYAVVDMFYLMCCHLWFLYIPCSVLALLRATVTASVVLHNKLLTHILRLPKSFFDTNPAGRVLNRFSRDIETMDSVLNQDISQFCNCFATYLATLIVISYATQWFGLAVVPITIVYIILQVRWRSYTTPGGLVFLY